MPSNLDRYKSDLQSLVETGDSLALTYQYICFPDSVEQQIRQHNKKDGSPDADARTDAAVAVFKKDAGRFVRNYHAWYSEAQSLIAQLLPSRVDDFVSLYKRPKTRKAIAADTYTLEDALDGLQTSRAGEVLTDMSAALPKIKQQVAILASVQRKFDSSLFDLRTLVQADILDSEIDVARELLKHKFFRAVGAVCGVVLEKHLSKVCDNRGLPIKKKATLSDFNDALKNADVIDVPTWRQIQHLADIRNLSVHGTGREPKSDEAEDLIDGTAKITKTVF